MQTTIQKPNVGCCVYVCSNCNQLTFQPRPVGGISRSGGCAFGAPAVTLGLAGGGRERGLCHPAQELEKGPHENFAFINKLCP